MQDQSNVEKTLLVAEDNQINLLVITRMLESLGFTYDAVENGIACLKLLGENNYELLLTDISMPQMDGLQLATEIRGLGPEKRNIPIIAMTANADLSGAEGFEAAGISDVLSKPFSKDDVRRCLEKWL